MPLYNGTEFLSDSIPSIINQTFQDWELIIGINGHVPHTYNDMVRKIKSFKDKRIKIIISNRKGKSKTLNKLLFHAKYKYICMMDVDDMWLPKKLEQQIPLAKIYDVIGTDTEYCGDKDGYPGLFLGKITPEMFSFQNPIINSSVLMKKEDAYWDEEWEGLDDYNMWIELLKKNKTFYNVPEVLTKHRIHKSSFFNNKNGRLNRKLIEEKIKKITEEEREALAVILREQKWDL